MTIQLPPTATSEAGLAALKTLMSDRSLLPALKTLRDELGDVFLLSFPGFKAIVMSGPKAAHFTYVEARDSLNWRTDDDPVTKLLRHGLLVEDGESHDELRRGVMPDLHRQKIEGYAPAFIRRTDQICDLWDLNQPLDMLVEMRRIALLILMETLFDVDITTDMDSLWHAIHRTLKYISPGVWLVWPDAPRPGFKWALREIDEYLYRLIAEQRQNKHQKDNLLSHLIESGMSDDLIRDQMLTLMIAGHDTSTALLSWALYLLTLNPEVMQQAREEVDSVIGAQVPTQELVGNLTYLEQVIYETMRLYPPIHVSNRRLLKDLEFNGYHLPAGERLMFSIYLTHHDSNHWRDPERFDPQRFAPGTRREPYTFIPFGGGPRNCIGTAFARVEAKVVLARLLQRYKFDLFQPKIHLYMGATLEPRPGVLIKVSPR